MASSAVEIANPLHAAPNAFEIGKLGMWLFFVGETMIFGGLMGCYALLMAARGGAGAAGAHVAWGIGAVNTLVLFTGGLTAALAQNAARDRDLARVKRYLSVAALLGLLFLLIKAFEYAVDVAQGFTPLTNLFWSFYYLMTGLHVLHVLVGILVTLVFIFSTNRRTADDWLERKLLSPAYHSDNCA